MSGGGGRELEPAWIRVGWDQGPGKGRGAPCRVICDFTLACQPPCHEVGPVGDTSGSRRGSESAGPGALSQGNGLLCLPVSWEPSNEPDAGESGRDGTES